MPYFTFKSQPSVDIVQDVPGTLGCAKCARYGHLASNNPGGWPGLLFDGPFASGNLQYVNVHAASSDYGNAIGMCNSIDARDVLTHELYLAHSSVTDFGGWCDDAGIYAENSHIVIEDTVFASHPTAAGAALRDTGNSTVLVSRSQIESNSGRALQVEGDTAFVKVVNSTLIGNGLVSQPTGGVRNTGRATVILGGEADAGNAIFANQGFGAQQVNVSGTIAASYNWWGDAAGPMHASNPGGLGEDVSDRVVYTPWITTTLVLPTPDLVHVFGPRSVSSGETVNLAVQFQNPLTEILHDVVLVADLPPEAEYVDSPDGTLYMKQRQIFWRAGDLAPRQVVQVTLRVRFRWGLPAHLWTTAMARVVARNFGNPALGLNTYLNYQGTYIVSQQPLTRQQVTDTLAADPQLGQMVLRAQSEGFGFYGNAYTVTLSDGTSALDLMLMPRDPAHSSDLLVVRRADDLRFTLRVAPDRLLGYDGGLLNFTVNVNNRQFDWGALMMVRPGVQSLLAANDWKTGAVAWQFVPAGPAGCQGDECKVDESTCVRNCLVKDLGLDAIGDLIPELGMAQSAASCIACARSRDPETCTSCAVALNEKLGSKYSDYSLARFFRVAATPDY